MTSLPVEAHSGSETSSKENDINLLQPHKKSKGFNILYRHYSNLKKVHVFYILAGLHVVVVFVELVLYIHGQQLRSYRDGQLSYPHCSSVGLLRQVTST